MIVQRHETVSLLSTEHMVGARQKVREWAVALGFSLAEQTKLVTAASELARNTLIHGGGGVMRLEVVSNSRRQGLRLTFTDQGPGIADVELALRDGYSTGNGLGLGLGGSRRLVNEFEIESGVGQGTRVTVIKWK